MKTPYVMICSLMMLTPVLRGETDFWFGPGYQAGDVTYSLGGAYWAPNEGGSAVAAPASELVFPLGGPVLQGGFTTRFASYWEAALSGSIMLGDPSDACTDSDWNAEGELFIYSDSDASLDAYDLDIAVRRWLGGPGLDIAIGAGLIYQSQSWELSNVDQGYPLDPGLPHDRVAGLIGSYDVETWIPYVEIAARGGVREWSFWGRAMLSPYTQLNDVDDHKLRSILAETSATGFGGALEGTVRRDLPRAWFAELRGRALGYCVSGTEQDITYDGPDKGESWEIEHEVTSTQLMLTLAIGLTL
jgi:hypothetical protein